MLVFMTDNFAEALRNYSQPSGPEFQSYWIPSGNEPTPGDFREVTQPCVIVGVQ